MSTNFIRLQNRRAPIHPHSDGVYHHNPPKKKYIDKYSVDEKERKDWIEEDLPSSTPPPFNPYKTQRKRIEKRITTVETKVRKENSPCIVDLLNMRSVILREKEIESKRDKMRLKQQEIISKLEDALGKGGVIDDRIDEDETVDFDDESQLNAEFKERSIFIKERKYVAGRCSAKLHEPLSKFQIYRLATRVYWSLTSTRDKPVAQVLPWMFLGSKAHAANLQYLLDNGFTHILNVTQEVKRQIFNFILPRFRIISLRNLSINEYLLQIPYTMTQVQGLRKLFRFFKE